MKTSISKIAICAKDMKRTAAFYEKHFGFRLIVNEDDRLIELGSRSGGCKIVILQASKGHKVGQSCVKLVFDVKNVEKFREEKLREGLKFGNIHQCDGYVYSNARDPGKNPIQISSRAFRSER
jgi:predicted enzyme related to lactoylglutathione lyase